MVAAASSAGKRRHDPAIIGALSAHRRQLRARAGRPHEAHDDCAGRQHGAKAGRPDCQPRPRSAACLFLRRRRHRRKVPGAARRSALGGWDTHYKEGIATGWLAQLLGALDGTLAAVQENMGPAWGETVVVLVTEFGRTARINGTNGTDHGTATVMLLAGGALKGGRVIADWPGLKAANLLENRDLKPTIDVRAVLKGLLKDHLRASDHALAADVFPGSDDVKPIAGLVASS